MSASFDEDVGRAASVLTWSQTNGKIMGRPTAYSYIEQKKLPWLYKRIRMKKTSVLNLKIHVSIGSVPRCWKNEHIKKLSILWSTGKWEKKFLRQGEVMLAGESNFLRMKLPQTE